MEKILNLIIDKLDSLDQKVNMMNQRLDAVDQRLDAIDQRLDAVDQKVNTLEQRQNEMDQRFTAELQRQGDLLQQLINTVVATNVKVTEMNEKMVVIEMKVDSVIDEVKEIKNSRATKQDLEYYDQKISEHSRQIYKLKNQ